MLVFSSCTELGLLFAAVLGLLIAVVPLVAEHSCTQAASVVEACGSTVVTLRLQSTGSAVVALGLSCSPACGIFPSRGQTLPPALASGFLSTAPPGTSKGCFWFFGSIEGDLSPSLTPHPPPAPHKLNRSLLRKKMQFSES